MSNMTDQEHRVYHRPRFDPAGRIIARHELKFGAVVYAPTSELPSANELGLDRRALLILWEQGAIDTLPTPPVAQVPTFKRQPKPKAT